MILGRTERMIARRYLLPGRGETFIFMVASISLGAVALGVAALIVVMSVMNGFRAELFGKIVGLNGHAIIQGYQGRNINDWQTLAAEAKATPGVVSAIPLIEQPLAALSQGRVEPILVRGMRVGDLRQTIRHDVKDGDLAEVTPGSGNVAIGTGLAQALGVGVGDTITVLNPSGQSTPFGTAPRELSYRVAATFEVGVYDFDKAYVVLPMEDAQELLLMGNTVGMVELRVTDPDKVTQILAPLAPKVVRDGQLVDWRQMNASLFQALEVERITMFVVLGIVILIAAFNILSSLIMLVRAKTRDIAILRTMGASRGAMLRIFMTVGMTIGVLGILLGIVLGTVFLYFRQDVVDVIQAITGAQLWDPSVRVLTELPSKPDLVDNTVIIAMTLVLTFLATLYPAYKASSTDPVQVLRYE
ncbi:lipoprotein-releasing ABC transporter permease subunit [Sphingomonas abietis]|uniref:Lipoprotein-releasing ABC transporter permease subunit n=1 Tax=Sphingomonas abietis TaxID=3012344 RepID=A0ABY7NRT0_9SPHN|nr:lipoprotein-releasing ABC transporter permease subunit [Sphingomonas abietis]WBO23675.1 lipoprotein-releasing ABC transporter permease subunit [Sphingomonas abietis]